MGREELSSLLQQRHICNKLLPAWRSFLSSSRGRLHWLSDASEVIQRHLRTHRSGSGFHVPGTNTAKGAGRQARGEHPCFEIGSAQHSCTSRSEHARRSKAKPTVTTRSGNKTATNTPFNVSFESLIQTSTHKVSSHTTRLEPSKQSISQATAHLRLWQRHVKLTH